VFRSGCVTCRLLLIGRRRGLHHSKHDTKARQRRTIHLIHNQQTVMPPRKNQSRKGKKEWRRNVDLTDVEAALQDKLLEQRLMYVFDEEKITEKVENQSRKWRMAASLSLIAAVTR
jgi:hypothetical protein